MPPAQIRRLALHQITVRFECVGKQTVFHVQQPRHHQRIEQRSKFRCLHTEPIGNLFGGERIVLKRSEQIELDAGKHGERGIHRPVEPSDGFGRLCLVHCRTSDSSCLIANRILSPRHRTCI